LAAIFSDLPAAAGGEFRRNVSAFSSRQFEIAARSFVHPAEINHVSDIIDDGTISAFATYCAHCAVRSPGDPS